MIHKKICFSFFLLFSLLLTISVFSNNDNEPVLLKFRSQDVIHSAFLPHFRVQMNCVPGITTQFGFTPNKTTAQMKESEGEDFEYVLLCNKICGASHFNMQMKFIVETQQEYDIWIASQDNLEKKLLTQK